MQNNFPDKARHLSGTHPKTAPASRLPTKTGNRARRAAVWTKTGSPSTRLAALRETLRRKTKVHRKTRLILMTRCNYLIKRADPRAQRPRQARPAILRQANLKKRAPRPPEPRVSRRAPNGVPKEARARQPEAKETRLRRGRRPTQARPLRVCRKVREARTPRAALPPRAPVSQRHRRRGHPRRREGRRGHSKSFKRPTNKGKD